MFAGVTTVDSLMEAVRDLHGNEIKFMNQEDTRRQSALHVAAREGNVEVIACLLKRKAAIKWLVN